MVNGTSIRRLAALPLATPRVSSPRGQKRPVFSIDTSASAAASVEPKQASAILAAPSQVNAGAADFRQLFGGLQATLAPVAATVWSFVPSFRTATGTDGLQVWGLNRTYFATPETAQWIANRYGTGKMIELPFGGSGGPFSASANEYHI